MESHQGPHQQGVSRRAKLAAYSATPRRTLRARYRLVELSTGAVVLDATAGSDAGIDVVSSQYATIAAEQTALERLSEVVADQMVGRLALFVARTPATP